MLKIFEGLKPYQKAEFLIMLFLAFAIPFSWLVAQYCEVALLVCAVLKVVFYQKCKPNERQLRFKWAYIIFALTWAIYFIGMIYTKNQSEGWAQVSKKLGFLIFPMIFLFSDMSYLTKDRVRAIFYCLVVSVLVFFLIQFGWALYDVIIKRVDTSRLFDVELMRIVYVHHSYMSMYAAVAMVFCAVELVEQKKMRTKILNAIAVLLLIVFVFLLDSRAGLLFMLLEIITLWVWITFVKKQKRFGMISLGALVLILAMVGFAVPNVYSRLAVTIKNLTSENRTDRRLVQLKGSLSAFEDNWLIGVGSGDRSDEILASYLRYRDKLVDEIIPMKGVDTHEFEEGRDQLLQKIMELTDYDTWNESNDETVRFIKEKSEDYKCDGASVDKVYVEYIYTSNAIYHELNTHNQFVDTMISVGIIGLLLMMAYFVVPLVLWIKTRRFDILFFLFLFAIGFNAMFESVFETQKGIIFFCFFNVLLFNTSFINDIKNNN